tara:strand:+ start:13498 stop:14976 length:1479 start_codon:yes stop_codon:yes gene_type:complete
MNAAVHEVIVIGSGFGGSTVAAKLVDAGIHVTLLERGPWRNSGAVEAAKIDNAAPFPEGKQFFSHALRRISAPLLPKGRANLHRDGLFDLHYDRSLSILCSSSVGGGSHVYSAMNVAPRKNYWAAHHGALSDDIMAPHYQWILDTMGSQTAAASGSDTPNDICQDEQRPDWMQVDPDAQPKMGFRFNKSTFTNNSFFGSSNNNKVSLDERLLIPRLGKGLSVLDRHEVLNISRHINGLPASPCSNAFRITVKDHRSGNIRTLISAKIILAAGTLNTLKLLFSSRAENGLNGMPALGLGIGGNGDVPAYWPCNDRARDFSTGAPCHGRFYLHDDPQRTNLTRYGINGVDGIPMPSALRKRLKQDLVLVGMGTDNANGIARWRKQKIQFEYLQAENPILNSIYNAFDKIGKLSGIRVWYTRRRPLTVHPYGGARCGANIDNSVIDANGEVHDQPGLFIADASALPAAPGVPPSVTIAAWASHLAAAFITNHGAH